MKKYLILIILLFVSACDKNEVTKIYYKSGKLKTELIYEKGKDNGIVKDYLKVENFKVKEYIRMVN